MENFVDELLVIRFEFLKNKEKLVALKKNKLVSWEFKYEVDEINNMMERIDLILLKRCNGLIIDPLQKSKVS